MIKNNDHWETVSKVISPQEYRDWFDSQSPQGSIFADILAAKNIDAQDGVAVIVMNYMDSMSLDLKRLKECSMTVTMKDGRIIPFCSYQLTNIYGSRLYPAWGEELLTEGFNV